MSEQNKGDKLVDPLENLKKFLTGIVEVLLTAFPNILIVLVSAFLFILLFLFYFLQGTPSLP
ncbi:hypothetical protein A3A93_03140 [Candidatus Roizmanbacteria bacterium RIFCSPLOWO2_01_FULL_38_12]|uniref:Uncharacterized protein n=1 Tax=Candidatus Roizmanbacteria bacterium RIFCSPLOWO2_01_FULL_38_12 TaxID=1802061 RepID=A0A1F7ISN8_9BACT|nr:MAG: hypothetical protein A2861_03805 [Candidatus Roizmanbacteria bacterium RIFCSPHIGHO2_01_FULL_38_15]OGK35528.1 MAG: hypothetical protein A3F59_05790 [Candidatus Roizmanbacteria bacterium RIFCSPHIGHO2_12_FULL_38_13]OGK46345.1 MAG: hypothetical protein A3A93_03140 [Candidatus Roizmanbacteria bacterium RIFCSPLOWO2_01_FULL_38_12]